MHVHVEKQSPPKIAVDYTRKRSLSHFGSSVSLLRGKHYHPHFFVLFQKCSVRKLMHYRDLG